MTDEIMKVFVEQLIECMEGITEALRLVLQEYRVNIAEREFEERYGSTKVTLEEIKELFVKCREDGKEDKVRELLMLFHVEKLSDLEERDYADVYSIAKDF